MIRLATPADTPIIAQLWHQLARYHVGLDARLPIPAPDGTARYEMRIASAIQDTQSRVLVAESDGQIIGYTIGVVIDLLPEMFEHEQTGFLADIYVHADYQGQGYGRKLVETLRDWFATRGIQHFEWHVAAQNPDAIAFWKRMGGQTMMLRMRASTTDDANH